MGVIYLTSLGPSLTSRAHTASQMSWYISACVLLRAGPYHHLHTPAEGWEEVKTSRAAPWHIVLAALWADPVMFGLSVH